jgi:hypothetical protein
MSQGTTAANDRLKFSWKGGTVAKTDFGDPRTRPPLFCLYDGGGDVLFSAEAFSIFCGGTDPCWTDTPDGFRYRDPLLQSNGIRSMSFSAGAKGRISLKGRGANLGIADLPPAAPVTARVRTGTGGKCFDAPLSRVTSTTKRFVARLP